MTENSAIESQARELREAIAEVRRQWRRRILLEGAVAVLAAIVIAMLAGFVLTSLLGPAGASPWLLRTVGYLVIVAALARFVLIPAMRQVDDERIALYVEEHAPDLRQAFLSAVHSLRSDDRAATSPALVALVMRRALEAVRSLEDGAVIERPRARRASGGLVAIAAVGALLVALGPAALREVARTLFVPWSTVAAAPVPAVMVVPGNMKLPRGAALDIRADLHGFVSSGAELVVRSDSSQDWVRIPMMLDSTGRGYQVRVFDVTRNTDYFVEASGVRSSQFRLTVTDLPTVRQLSVELRFPAYTNLPPERKTDGGDIAAVAGTTALLTVTPTMPVRSGVLHFDDGSAISLTLAADGSLAGAFKVTHDGFYRIDLASLEGIDVPGTIQHTIEVLQDHAPRVQIEKPGRDTRVTAVDEVPIAVRADDDYGVRAVALIFSANGGPERRVVLTDSLRKALTDFRAVHTIFLEEFSLQPGDLVAYHAEARDAAGHKALSDLYFLEVRRLGRDYRQADDNGGGGGRAGGRGGANPGQLTERQRQILVGTFNWQRDSALKTALERGQDATTLAISQGKLQADVRKLADQIEQRRVAETDTGFRSVKAELDTAAREMKDAEEGLGRKLMGMALPPEQRALQHLQRAEALNREAQVRMGGGGGGGGGGGAGSDQRRAEDLADLFEMQTDKMRNQYEAVQRERSSERSAQQQIDSTAERLKQLASRLEQENQRMQRAADSLSRRLPQQQGGGGAGGQQGQQSSRQASSLTRNQPGARSQSPASPGGGSAQRELARQADSVARQLERLSRERQSQELAQAAREMQNSADALRRAAAGSPSEAAAALSGLRNAQRNVDQARANSSQDDIKDLARRAQDLASRQQEIAKDVNALTSAAPNDRGEQGKRLDQQKDALSEGLDKLQQDADRVARDARREQPKAAAAVAQAADQIRESRLPDRIQYSKGVMRNGSPDYARAFEEQIREQIAAVRDKLGNAVGNIGESAEQRQQRALAAARDLVRDLQSLNERTANANRRDLAQGQQRQQGQQAGQGQGQGRPQGQQPGGQQRGGQGGVPSGNGTMSTATTSGDDQRQFGREVGARRQQAEQLRRDLAQQGVDLAPLDAAINQLRQLEGARSSSDPGRTEALQAAVIASLKTVEFDLWRRFNGGADGRPALGATAQVPPEYRAMVEEYYRALARRIPK